jgi:hypothetical protein
MTTASKYKQEKSLLFFIKIILFRIRNTLGNCRQSMRPVAAFADKQVEDRVAIRGTARSIKDYGQAAAQS